MHSVPIQVLKLATAGSGKGLIQSLSNDSSTQTKKSQGKPIQIRCVFNEIK